MYPRMLDLSAADSTDSACAMVSALDGLPFPLPTGQSQSRTTFLFTRSRACALVIVRRRIDRVVRSVDVTKVPDFSASHRSTSSAVSSTNLRAPSSGIMWL
jgi:hypothetical protein